MARKQEFSRGAAAGVAGTLLVLIAAGLMVVYTGAYNVAATAGHGPFARWLLGTTMRNSVESQAQEIAAPARFTAADVTAGAAEYKAMCQHCHGGPGVSRTGWAEGIVPMPPELTHAAGDWRSRELFWIIKHGIRMSAMPAFGPTHDDATLWNIAAFVKQLPAMSPEQYQALRGEHRHAGSGGGSGDGHAGHSH